MPSESFGSVRIFWLDREEARRRIGKAAQELVDSRPDVLACYLFGSLAEGRAVPGSDADVLVVLDRSDRRWMDRPLEYDGPFRGIGMPVELFCYTVDELGRVPLASRALEHGVLVAGADVRQSDSPTESTAE